MSKRNAWVQIGIFIAFIALFFILNLVLPDKDFSPQENRYLQQLPKFSFSDLFSGKFTKDFEKYTTDQFTLRDTWTTLKARCELASGKKENNGVYYCGDNTLITRFDAPADETLDKNMSYVNALADNVGDEARVYFALIPGAAEIWKDKLPENAPNDSQLQIIEKAYGQCRAQTVDMYSELNAHKDEYIFYRTDHHWTSLGAFYGYTSLCGALGLDAPQLSDYSPRTVSEDFYGTVYSSSGMSWIAPDSIQIFREDDGSFKLTNYPKGTPVEGKLYDESFLEKKDKYAMFMGGNTPLLTIETENTDAPSILILRDSYMDSLTPFLLDNFSNIHIIDLRYYRTSIADYVRENNIANVLVCYSVVNFSTDQNLFLMAK